MLDFFWEFLNVLKPLNSCDGSNSSSGHISNIRGVLQLTHRPEQEDGLDGIVLVLFVVDAQIGFCIVRVCDIAEHVVQLAILQIEFIKILFFKLHF